MSSVPLDFFRFTCYGSVSLGIGGSPDAPTPVDVTADAAIIAVVVLDFFLFFGAGRFIEIIHRVGTGAVGVGGNEGRRVVDHLQTVCPCQRFGVIISPKGFINTVGIADRRLSDRTIEEGQNLRRRASGVGRECSCRSAAGDALFYSRCSGSRNFVRHSARCDK